MKYLAVTLLVIIYSACVFDEKTEATETTMSSSHMHQGMSSMTLPSDLHTGTTLTTTRNTFTIAIFTETKIVGANTLDFTITDANATPITNATITAALWMPMMKHGSQAPTGFLVSGNTYRINNLVYSMAGIWDITITITSGAISDSVIVTREI